MGFDVETKQVVGVKPAITYTVTILPHVFPFISLEHLHHLQAHAIRTGDNDTYFECCRDISERLARCYRVHARFCTRNHGHKQFDGVGSKGS